MRSSSYTTMSRMSTTSSTTLRTDDTSKVLPGDKTGLPLEIWQIIFSYLSFRDLCYVARVSKTWYDLALSIDVTRWKELYMACQEWRHPYWPLNSNLEPSSWKLAFRNQYVSTRFWYRCSMQAHKAGCMTLWKRVRERQNIEVGPGLQHETLKSAFTIANEYDRILVHPGIYDEQLEMSMKLPFELVGVGELGSIILVVSLEHVAVSGRFSNLVLRAPWFTNFIFKVRSGYLQMDNCIMEDGMMCVANPASCHIQFCTFRHATIILQHVNASVIRNCEFSQSNNANIVVEGYPKEEKSWAYPYLCQQMDTAVRQKPSPNHPHPLKVTESTTSTLHSTFTGKSFTASTLDNLSRGRAGSQDAGLEGKKLAGGHAATGHLALNKAGVNSSVAQGSHGKQTLNACVVQDSAERHCTKGADVNNVEANAAAASSSCSHDVSAESSNLGAKEVEPQCCVCKSGPQDTGPCKHASACSAACADDSSHGEDEWLEINDERKAWQLVGEEDMDRRVEALLASQCACKDDEKTSEGMTASSVRGAQWEHSHCHEQSLGGRSDMPGHCNTDNEDNPVNYANGITHDNLNDCRRGSQSSESARKYSNEKIPQNGDPAMKHSAEKPHKPQEPAVTNCVVSSTEPGVAGCLSDTPSSHVEDVPQVVALYQSRDGLFSGDMLPHDLPPHNSDPSRYHYHDPPLLHNPHPHPTPHHSQQAGVGVQSQADNVWHLPRVEHLPSNGVAAAHADAAERRSERSFHSSRAGESSSEEEDDLSILNELEAEASSNGGSDLGNHSTSSSDEESDGEELFHGNSEYDSSDAEESVIMLPHLRQKHLDASVSANAVNADVDSICSHTSPPVTLSTWQDEGVLTQVHRVRGCLIHQCRMIHSKGGVMVSLQGHALISSCDISNVSYGIRCIQNARVVVVKNRIHHCRTSGIFMRLAASGLIAGNDIHSNNEAGLDIRKNADPIVQHNRIHHGKRSGVVVLGSGRGQIRSNSIYSNTEAGIYILYGGNPTVSENHIYDGKAAGVAINEGGRGFIFDNMISGNQWGGVDIRRSSCPMVCRNTITNGLGDGMVIGDQGQGTIENNVIADNAGCGLWLMSASRPYIHGNQINNNGDTGVMMVNKTDIQQEGVHLLPPAGDGLDPMASSISVTGALLDDHPHPAPKCSHTTLQHNNIYHNAGRGIAVELGEKVEVKYNAIYANHQDGVWVHQEAQVTLLANSIASNYGHGVVTALTPSVDIVGNGIYDNQEWGIQGSGGLCVVENDVVSNHHGGISVHGQSVCKIQDNRIQTTWGPVVKLADGISDSVVEGNTLFQGHGKTVQDLSHNTVVRDNKVVESLPHPEKDIVASRHRMGKDAGGFNKSYYLHDPSPRPAIQPPPPPSTLPAHNVSTVTKVIVPSGDACQQGSKLCCVL